MNNLKNLLQTKKSKFIQKFNINKQIKIEFKIWKTYLIILKPKFLFEKICIQINW